MAHSTAEDGGSIPGAAAAKIVALIQRLEKGERNNSLDVLIEVALFEPDEKTFDAVPNAAGSKVIYANRDGSFSTHWAREWTNQPTYAARLLQARVADSPGSEPTGYEAEGK